MSIKLPKLATFVVAGLVGSVAVAAPLTVSSYDMPNGDGQAHGGSYNYWDATYSGSGNPTQDGSLLSGGTGKLTDGVIATQDWYAVSNNAGTGQYVGWVSSNPTITFHFASSVTVNEVKLRISAIVDAEIRLIVDGVSA